MNGILTDTYERRIADRLDAIRERIERACARSGRRSEDVALVGVSKTFPIEAIRAATEAGLRRFGENRVQELLPKIEALPGRYLAGEIEWHMIGHLQRTRP